MSLKVGLIGCGGIATFHVPGWEKAGAELVCVCDIDASRAQSFAEKHGISQWTTDPNAIFDNAEIGVVDVTTITSAHKSLCLGAIKAGKAVI